MLERYLQVYVTWCGMSRLIASHQPCSDCGSSDALAEYDTNTYCFSCGRSRSKSVEKSFFPELGDVNKSNNNSLLMPPNATARLSLPAQRWLLSYNLFEEEWKKYGIRYIHEAKINEFTIRDRLILPSFKRNGDLEFYQARALRRGDSPKYFTEGRKGLFWSIGEYEHKDSVVLVEDMISAMRVGQQVQAVALLGTKINEEQLLQLAEKYGTIIVWMDGDRPGQDSAKKIVKKATLMFPRVFNIVTRRDPKCLYDGEIKEKLAPYIT